LLLFVFLYIAEVIKIYILSLVSSRSSHLGFISNKYETFSRIEIYHITVNHRINQAPSKPDNALGVNAGCFGSCRNILFFAIVLHSHNHRLLLFPRT